MPDVVPAEYSQTPQTATYFHFRFPRGETGSGNQSPLVAFQSIPLEQLWDILAFYKAWGFYFMAELLFSHWHWLC